MATRDLRFNIFANDRASAAFARVSGAVESLANRLVRLDRQRARPSVDLDIAKVEAQIGQVERQLADLQRTKANPTIDADIVQVQAKIVQVIGQLRALGNQTPSPKVTLDTAVAQAKLTQLQAQLAQLNAEKADPKVDLDIASASAKLAALQAQLATLRDRKVTIDMDTDQAMLRGRALSTLLGDMTRSFRNAIQESAQFSRNIRQLGLPVGLAGLAGSISSLGASFREMLGVVGLAPGIFAAASASVATLAFAFNGLADAIGPRDTEAQITKADRAMERLGESAQEVAKQIISMKDVWNDLKNAIQDDAFAGVANALEDMGREWIPMLRNGLGLLATDFNVAALELGAFLNKNETLNQVNRIFGLMHQTMQAFLPSVTNVTAAFLDIGEVGLTILPHLASRFTDLTARFRTFVDQAAADGSLEEWIARGVEAAREFFDLLGNIGGVFGAFFDAAEASGASFIQRMNEATIAVRKFLESGQGQAGLIAFFLGVRELIDAILPSIKTVFGAIAEAFVILQPNTKAVGEAIHDIVSALAPTIPMLAGLASDILPAIAAGVSFLSSSFGQLIPTLLTLAVAFKVFQGVGALFLTLGAASRVAATNVGLAALAMTNSGRAGQAAMNGMTGFGNAMTRLGNSLPLIGVALIGIALAYEALRDKSDEVARAVLNGSKDFAEAVREEEGAIREADRATVQATGNRWTYGNAVGQQKLETQLLADAEERHGQAVQKIIGDLKEQAEAMTGVQRAQADLKIAQIEWNVALEQHGPYSREAADAQDRLTQAAQNLEDQQNATAEATKSHTERIIEQQAEIQGAISADLAYEQSLLRIERAEEAAGEAVREHGLKSLEAREAQAQLEQAVLSAADAAGRKAAADSNATTETEKNIIATQASNLELLRWASSADGPAREAAVRMLGRLSATELQTLQNTAAMNGFAIEIRETPDGKEVTVTTPGLEAARRGIQGLATDILNVNGKTVSIFVSATGQGGLASAGRLATGGILPGYTPGRDVHRFVGSAGMLELSGGEAIMRPEWTRAISPSYVNQANRAARMGGVAGVQRFLARTAFGDALPYAKGGIVGGFAPGGIVSPASLIANIGYARDLSVFNRAMELLEARAVELGKSVFSAMGGGTGMGYQAQMAALRAVFPYLQLTSGFREGAITATGNTSYHALGRAVDIPPSMTVFNWIAANYPGSRELIYTPAGGRQIHNGSPHVYSGVTAANHYDHIHWAMRRGGMIPAHLADQGGLLSSGHAAVNLSGAVERVLSPAQTRAYDSGQGRVADEVSLLRAEMRLLGQVLASRSGGDSFTINTPTAQEGVHATRMLLRSMR